MTKLKVKENTFGKMVINILVFIIQKYVYF